MIATVHGDGTDYVRSLGADEVIDTKSQDFQARGFLNFARRADAVIDTVGGKTQDQLFTLAKPGGIIVSSVARPDIQRAAECRVGSEYLIVDVNSVQLTRLAGMLSKKEIQTSVGSVLPLAEAPAAHQMLAGRLAHKRGKIVLRWRDEGRKCRVVNDHAPAPRRMNWSRRTFRALRNREGYISGAGSEAVERHDEVLLDSARGNAHRLVFYAISADGVAVS